MKKLLVLSVLCSSLFLGGCSTLGWRFTTIDLDLTIPVPVPVPYLLEETNDLTNPHKVQPTQEMETSTEESAQWLETDDVTEVYSKNFD